MKELLNWLRQFWYKIKNKMDSALAANKASAAEPPSSAPQPTAAATPAVAVASEEKPTTGVNQPDKPHAKPVAKAAVKPAAKKVAQPKAKKASAKELVNQVTADHIKQACEQIDRDGVPKTRVSKTSSVVVDGSHYPPRYVLALAVEAATGSPQPLKNVDADGVLKSLGFDIVVK